MTDPSALDLAGIKKRHFSGPGADPMYCSECLSDDYPCDAIHLCDEIDRLRAENERYRVALEKMAALDNSIYQISGSTVARAARRALAEEKNDGA